MVESIKGEFNLFNRLLEMEKYKGKNHIVLEDLKGKVKYKDMVLKSYVLGNVWKKKIREERVGVMLPNVNVHGVLLFSLMYAKKTPAMINFSMGESSLRDCIEVAGVKQIITSREFVETANLQLLVENLKNIVSFIYMEDIPNEISIIDKTKGMFNYKKRTKVETEGEIVVFTSGSEGSPKGVLLTHKNIFSNILQANEIIELDKDEVFFSALPMFHSFGLTVGVLFPVMMGMKAFLYPSPLHYREIPKLIKKKKATVLLGTSTFLGGYSKGGRKSHFSSLKYVVAGGERLREEVRTKWKKSFDIDIIEGYGVTEASPLISANIGMREGTVGKLVPYMEAKIEKVEGIKEGGKLLVKGPNIMKGYLLKGEGFVPVEEWYDTGDIVTIDEDGIIEIVARLKRFAKIGGEMVSLNLVESIFEEKYESSEFAAVSIEDDRKGEKIIIYTSIKDIDTISFNGWMQSKGYSNLLIPSEIRFIEEFPIFGTGKVNYIELTSLANKFSE